LGDLQTPRLKGQERKCQRHQHSENNEPQLDLVVNHLSGLYISFGGQAIHTYASKGASPGWSGIAKDLDDFITAYLHHRKDFRGLGYVELL